MKPFPELSRSHTINMPEALAADPTLRDQMQSGAEATALQFPRGRRQWDVTIELLTWADKRALDQFVRSVAVYGVNPFLFRDTGDPTNPIDLRVKFSTCPSYKRVAAAEGIRLNCTFQLREL